MKKALLIITVLLFLFHPFPTLHADDAVSEYINSMTLSQKIGQLIVLGFQKETLSEKDVAHLKNINPGGIVFYARNLNDATDLAPLITKIKSINMNHELPMFFAIDQEGGIVHRIEGEYYKPPSQPAIGITNSEAFARKVGLSVGNALRNLGININLAPVLDVPADVFSSPMTLRSYSNDPKTVERLGIAYINGLKDAGLLSAAKHFPGIGRASEDSHHILPHITWKTQDEKKGDIMPFQGAIKAGVDIIMAGHFIAEPGDEKNSISLSSYWMKDVLRKDMGFDGLIIVDNIEMKSIEEIMPISEAAVKSLKAGADMIMVSHKRENQKAVFNALVNAAKKGDISIERLNESLRRIIAAKKKITSCSPDKKISNDLKELSRLVAENSVTAFKLKDAPLSSIRKDEKVLFVGNDLVLFDAIKNFWEQTEIIDSSLANFRMMKPGIPITEFLRKFDAIVIDADYGDAPEMVSICNDLNLKYIVVLSHPLNVQRVLAYQPKSVVIVYESSKTHFATAIEIISGNRPAKGRLPYNLTLPVDYTYD